MGGKPNNTTSPKLEFTNTEIAFGSRSDADLKHTARLFRLMNNRLLTKYGSSFGLLAIRWGLPFAQSVVRKTIFKQFCGGTTLLESEPTIKSLFEYDVATILDYGAEAKSTEKDFNKTMNETLRAIDFAASNKSVPVVSTKITGLSSFNLLAEIQAGADFNKEARAAYRNLLKRIDAIAYSAAEKGVSVFVDAEESWIQDGIDHVVNIMMKRYNRTRAVIYNTFQMYRHDRLQFLFDSYERAQKEGYVLGAKLVRGAYMEKERARADEKGYQSPIQPSKAATDDAYDTALRFCVDNYEKIALCNATHNIKSSHLLAQLIDERGLQKNHPHLNFCQLYGMSDNITYNLAAAGFNVAKYVVYGPIKDVVPYLIRRAQENTAVTGDMSREYKLIQSEVKRRGI